MVSFTESLIAPQQNNTLSGIIDVLFMKSTPKRV